MLLFLSNRLRIKLLMAIQIKNIPTVKKTISPVMVIAITDFVF